MDHPVVLTGAQQDAIAELASIMRSNLYLMQCGNHVTAADVGEEIIDLLERLDGLGFTPQSFDRIYDTMHRSGANA